MIGVFNTKTKEWTNYIAINGSADEMPSGWKLRDNERWVGGSGHAEETILKSLGLDEVVAFGGTSRNICEIPVTRC